MIYKSYIVEQNIRTLKENCILFYGENLGLKNEIKNKIRSINIDSEIIIFNQEEILKNNNLLINEIQNISLFEKKKIYFINDVSDKILPIIEGLETESSHKIYLFSEILDKKSKIRNYFEKSKKFAAIACYPDNDITIKKIILERLKGYQGLTNDNLNLIIESCSLDRMKLTNEINKITICFKDKNINTKKLEHLLNIRSNDDFNKLRDQAINGNKFLTNKLLNDTILENDKNIFYISSINQRLTKIKELNKLSIIDNIENAIEKIKPPVFWKDKPNFIIQAKKWDEKKINKILKKTYSLEKSFKKTTFINKEILIKNLIIDICVLANS